MHNDVIKTETKHEKKLLEKENMKNFIKNMNKYIITSRFSNATWKENRCFVEKNEQIKCIYCSPDLIAKKIPIDSIMFVLEMNNDKNQIMGIGMVRNHPVSGKYRVYSNGNYNRYVFTGKYRIDREDMTEDEEKIMMAFDILCFKGNSHMKRGQGLKSFPIDILFRCKKIIDLVEFVSEMFKKRMNGKTNTKI
jgi:hypothetical protein